MKTSGRSGPQPTVADVARAAGVSRATAARVLGGYGYAGSEAREQVLEAAKRLAYQPNQLARSMATGRSKTIGVVVADIENLYFARAIRAITDTANANGFDVVLANTDEDIEMERAALRVMLAKRVDGLIVSPASSFEVDHLIEARNMGCPFVLLDRRVPALEADTVAIDNFPAARNAVSSFTRQGHRRIALISNSRIEGGRKYLTSPVRERLEGYKAALHEAGIRIDPKLTVFGGGDNENLARKVRKLCQDDNRPTAFLAVTSAVALVVLSVLREDGLSVPEDVSLICFENADWTVAVTPPLTVIAQPIKELASAVTERLIARLNGGSSLSPEETLLSATLINRGSVKDLSSDLSPDRRSA
ncbi:LacI family DNA-binding transcriptional regulator [Agrobacterium tumefaciens]|uniref:LacI family transcriptional regulator n=1 Tax=Agrobacterium tumefaciens TaxID=358 RepID=A0A2L2LLP9_AGRTU|nr:LacI family DNA-binding transcriptional regulator [Agrobacterium tumefaciens]AVH45255.1 LacI family transcriptional regulator [Agrobacterium tumefaciens]NSY99470.1 LacI family transcriptional regulator [Agrobacterium tumefaciens]